MNKLIEITDFKSTDFQNLFEEYLIDIRKYEYIEANKKGLYGPKWLEYFFNASLHIGYYIIRDGKKVGFVLLTNKCFYAKDKRMFLAEFFVKNELRKLGIGSDIAKQILLTKSKRWEITMHPKNLISIKFWNKVLNDLKVYNFMIHNDVEEVFDNELAIAYDFEI